ncbi:SMC-Scp complex subunit ScpB [archaeon]|jgi:segregation and condensation protein B|nr:SMC-Scp complex subunit ScpB [archaeon]MBT3451169.1 SMC-Scp complex subunit ScpB [archaeon]MBT6869703.1 SMC-Scp complex subunit ScpB [archaeon]MBT7192632.1 SMC-Scp complex subunit ScpB [archaeon]MBT7380517.1 SMC-Scp complex subunit ScpB [archaeon]
MDDNKKEKKSGDSFNSPKKKVEAVLFAVGKEISTERIASLCSLETKEVENLIQQLIKEYDEKDHSLKIAVKDNGWKLTVRDEFIPLVSSIVSSTELDQPIMETLAVVAWLYPIIQSEIIKIRGTGAYEHMKLLLDEGFIDKERFGRTYKVKLTQKFFNYFDLPSDEAKQAFLKQVPDDILKDAEEINKEIDEIKRLNEQTAKEESSKSEIKKAMESMKK